MLQYDFGMLCESAIVDQQTNHLSILNVLEGFNFSKLPGNLPKMYFVASWSKSTNQKKEQKELIKLILTGPNNNKDGHPETQIEVVAPANKKRLRTLIEVGGLPIYETGEHKLIVEIKKKSSWEEVDSIVFDVTNNIPPEDTLGLPKTSS